ncbi:MAG: hypothetical protein V4659_00290 [Pseudomonadota bacterium]
MKILAMIAAVLLATGTFAAAPASADTRVRVAERTQVRYDNGRRYDRDRQYRGDRRRSSYRWRTKCHTQWRDGRRERVCRRIRYRR